MDIDQLRAREYSRLDSAGQVYLDYTGGSLYAASQIEKHLALLRDGVLGNPHSANPTSIAMTNMVERARAAVLDYFNAGDYHVVFTQNATGALKLVGEAFCFAPGGEFLACVDNHNSVNGIREFARASGASVTYAPLDEATLRIDDESLNALLIAPARGPRLFAYPAQSNYTGVKHSLSWVAAARSYGWAVMLDAASYVPTNALNLAAVQPDFVCISFYKMFGYPTGIGALLIHRNSMGLLRRPWFAGGTVNLVSVQGQAHALSAGEAAFEDGTLNYLSIPAVEIGLQHLRAVGIDTINRRVVELGAYLLTELQALRHSNGRALAQVYGPTDMRDRGATITFNVYDRDGARLDYRRVEELAGQSGISLRAGCFCNPGANETAEGLTEEEMLAGFANQDDISLPSFIRLMKARNNGKSAGAIRASLGIASNRADVDRLIEFLASFLDRAEAAIGQVTVDDDNCRVIRDGS